MAPLPNRLQMPANSSRERAAIRLEDVPLCPVCGGTGTVAYEALKDRLCGVPGEWRLQRCSQDGGLWLDPRPVAEDLSLCYPGNYFTHDVANGSRAPAGATRRERIGRAILAERYGYSQLENGTSLPTALSRCL